MEFTAAQIAGFLKGTVEGNPEEKVYNVSKIDEGEPGTLTFLSNPKYTHYIYLLDMEGMKTELPSCAFRSPVHLRRRKTEEIFRIFVNPLEKL